MPVDVGGSWVVRSLKLMRGRERTAHKAAPHCRMHERGEHSGNDEPECCTADDDVGNQSSWDVLERISGVSAKPLSCRHEGRLRLKLREFRNAFTPQRVRGCSAFRYELRDGLARAPSSSVRPMIGGYSSFTPLARRARWPGHGKSQAPKRHFQAGAKDHTRGALDWHTKVHPAGRF